MQRMEEVIGWDVFRLGFKFDGILSIYKEFKSILYISREMNLLFGILDAEY